MSTAFTPMLRRALEAVPGAVGCVFLDWDGEAVDQVTVSRATDDDLKLVGAYYGIILGMVQRWLNTYHYGSTQEIILSHEGADLLVHVVSGGYFVVLMLRSGHLGTALSQTRALAQALHLEMA
jgi:predicted regulator of Ras-like GTPase activity (Roadblock/LC7/MglB family)